MSKTKMEKTSAETLRPTVWQRSLLLLSMMMIAVAFFSSCKDELLPSNEQSETIAGLKTLDTGSDGGDSDGDDTRILDCASIKKNVFMENGLLVFENDQHFWECAECLEQDYDAYNDAYDAQYPDVDSDKMDELDIINNFNQWLPFEDFENSKNHNSLRAAVEAKIENWLKTSGPDLDFNSDPENSIPVMMENVRVLYNGAGLVKIGKDIHSMDEMSEDNLSPEDDQKVVWDNCANARYKTYYYGDDNSPLPSYRTIKVRVGVLSGWTTSNLYGKMTSYKYSNSQYGWKKSRLKMKVSVNGKKHTGSCGYKTSSWSKTRGYKKRSSLRVTDSDWWDWREAFVCQSHPDFSQRKSRVRAWIKNMNFTFGGNLTRSFGCGG